jgi:phage shock protein C
MTTPKRLFRSKEKKIAGVAGGLADYLNLDPTIIRLLFVVIAFAGGASVLVYLIMWLVVPEENAI